MTSTLLEVVVLTNNPALDLQISQVDEKVNASARAWSLSRYRPRGTNARRRSRRQHLRRRVHRADVPLELCLEVSRHLDLYHPEVGVVLLRESSAELWRDAARSGIRDIVEPDAIDTDLVPALLAAAERSAEIRAVQSSPPEQVGPGDRRVVAEGRQRQDDADDQPRYGDRCEQQRPDRGGRPRLCLRRRCERDGSRSRAHDRRVGNVAVVRQHDRQDPLVTSRTVGALRARRLGATGGG